MRSRPTRRAGSAPSTWPGSVRMRCCWSSCSIRGRDCRSTRIRTAPSPPSTSATPTARRRRGSCSSRARSTWDFGATCRESELLDIVARQDTDALLGLLHRLTVAAGDAVYVPPGVLHATGEGVFLVEVQEPEDLSILLEWRDFELDGERDGHFGLGFPVVIDAVDARVAPSPRWRAGSLAAGRARTRGRSAAGRRGALLPAWRTTTSAEAPASVLDSRSASSTAGELVLETAHGGALELRRGTRSSCRRPWARSGPWAKDGSCSAGHRIRMPPESSPALEFRVECCRNWRAQRVA